MSFPSNRYKRIVVDGKKWYEHRYLWQEAHGPIPKGFHIHHIDGDPHNNDLSNLECVSHGTHNHIHHAKAKKPCAEPNCQKIARKRGMCDTHYVRYFRREKLNAYSLEYHRRKRAAMSPEQKEAARQAARDYWRRRRHGSMAS